MSASVMPVGGMNKEEEPDHFAEPHFEKQKPKPAEKTIVYQGTVKLPLYRESGQVELRLKDGVYKTTRPYESLTRFQLFMTNTKPCYLYAFASDETTGKATPVFPLENTSALLDYSENTVVYPSEEKSIQLDFEEGTDYLILLYSPEKLSLETLMKNYETAVLGGKTGEANLMERVRETVGKNMLMNPKQIEYEKSAVGFKGWTLGGEKQKILPVLIEIEHK
jgi:hypothetical protein